MLGMLWQRWKMPLLLKALGELLHSSRGPKSMLGQCRRRFGAFEGVYHVGATWMMSAGSALFLEPMLEVEYREEEVGTGEVLLFRPEVSTLSSETLVRLGAGRRLKRYGQK